MTTQNPSTQRVIDAALANNPYNAGGYYICPAHDDEHPSLQIKDRGQGTDVTCWAEHCKTKLIMDAFRLPLATLQGISRNGSRPKSNNKPPAALPHENLIRLRHKALMDDPERLAYWTEKRGISREVLEQLEVGWHKSIRSNNGAVGAYAFPIRDADGNLVNVKYRWNKTETSSKDFRLLRGRNKDLLHPVDQLDSEWLMLCEGEPDVLRALTSGIPAVTSMTGAGGMVKSAYVFAPLLKDINVIIPCDADDAGRRAAEQEGHIINRYAQSVRVLDLFPDRNDGSDLSDWLNTPGNDNKKLNRLVMATSPLPTEVPYEIPSHELLFPEGKFNPPRLGKAAEAAANLRTGPGRSLWTYENGVYVPEGEDWLAGYVRFVLDEEFRDSKLREVRAWCKATDQKIPTQPDIDYINVMNGILHWKEQPPKLTAHSPDIPSIVQIQAEWYPKANCPNIDEFFSQVLPDDCMDFIYEWFGYLLVPTSRRFQRHLMLRGPGDTGKSTLLMLAEKLLGPQATSSHSLQSLVDDRFTLADLYGKLANIYADLDAKNVQNSGKFKAIAGGDRVQAEFKFSDTFKFHPFARLMFSANEPPGTSDQSDAYYKRWLILPMDHKFAEEDQDKGLDERLTTDEELSGLLHQSVFGLKRLWARNRFEVPKSMKQAAAQYRSNTDTVVAWISERAAWERAGKERTSGVYLDYRSWCDENNRHPLGKQNFEEHLAAVQPRVSLTMQKGIRWWRGMKLKPDPDGPYTTVKFRSG